MSLDHTSVQCQILNLFRHFLNFRSKISWHMIYYWATVCKTWREYQVSKFDCKEIYWKYTEKPISILDEVIYYYLKSRYAYGTCMSNLPIRRSLNDFTTELNSTETLARYRDRSWQHCLWLSKKWNSFNISSFVQLFISSHSIQISEQ